MSFVIHVFENDAVRSVAEATRYVYGEPTPTPGLKQMLIAFFRSSEFRFGPV
jgi:hypothetical protein